MFQLHKIKSAVAKSLAALLKLKKEQRRSHQIGPGERTVFTHAREIEKRARSKYPYPHQSTRERNRPKRYRYMMKDAA
jgi:hypothetical protein